MPWEEKKMSDEEAITALVATVGKFKPGKPLQNYITHAAFPKFKSIEPGTRVDFNFPLTALVGANGIGKSSLLHALWGMPYGYSTVKFWFATELDPIEGTQKDPQRYFYGHWNSDYGGVVETRKARLGAKRDYWEPYRWSKADGMAPMPDGKYEGKSKDRWNPVKRKVVYINLKAAFGSFDRYFYFDDTFKGDKRDVMLLEARRLKRIKDENRQSYKLGRGTERLFENRDLTLDEMKQVSSILGRTYDGARLIRHSLYPGSRGHDLSVVFRRGAEYSEAFAGTGEIAAVSVVVDVMAAPENSLILLDEPETSLHPGAQRALLRFLLEQIKLKHHQVVLSTHSSEFLEGLPHDAIKVFEDNGKMQARILPRSSPSAALMRLGKVPGNKRRILVEDQIAELLVKEAMKGLDKGDAATLEVVVAPGGAELLLKYTGPTAAMVGGQNLFLYLDGDKKKVAQFTDPATVPPAEHGGLSALLKAELGTTPMFAIPGGVDAAGHIDAKVHAQLQYLAWLRLHCAFLPRRLPEHIVLEALEPGKGHAAADSAATKEAFIKFIADGAEVEASRTDIGAWAKLKIAKMPADNADLTAIRDQLTAWLHS